MDQLADILQGDLSTEKKSFAVTDYGSGNWAVSKAMDATTEIVRLQVQAEAWHQQIGAWLAKATAEYTRSVEYMESLLRPFVTEELKGKKSRHVTFPAGEAGFRKSPDRLDITDEAVALMWAKANCPEAVKVTETVQKTPLKKRIESTGEMPDGVKLVPGEERFYIKPIGEKE